jgi:hypothetical protein
VPVADDLAVNASLAEAAIALVRDLEDLPSESDDHSGGLPHGNRCIQQILCLISLLYYWSSQTRTCAVGLLAFACVLVYALYTPLVVIRSLCLPGLESGGM